MSELSRRILQRRLELGLSQEELAQRMGYRSKSSITKLEKGVNDIPQSKVEEFAAALETTPAWLMGLENTAFVPPGFEPLPEMVRVPLVGSIACGSPITAEQNIECYIGVPAAWHADFALTCHGSSMAPTICDGDIVCIRCQPEVEQGEIAAVRIGDEATLKHFHLQGETDMHHADNAADPHITAHVASIIAVSDSCFFSSILNFFQCSRIVTIQFADNATCITCFTCIAYSGSSNL